MSKHLDLFSESIKYLKPEQIHFLQIGHKEEEIRSLRMKNAELSTIVAKQQAKIISLEAEKEREAYLKKRGELEVEYGIVPGSRWGYSPETGEIDENKPEKMSKLNE